MVNKMGEVMTTTNKPCYCSKCGSRDSFIRQPGKDIVSETGKTMWQRWICKNSWCKNTAIYPVVR